MRRTSPDHDPSRDPSAGLLEGATWRVHEQTDSALLIDGRDYYAAFYAAATRAQRSILLLGWQFDSDVELLRGDDLPTGTASDDVRLLAVLDRLCRERPGLEVRVLAWDHSVFFALEREPLQKLYFDAITCKRFVFRWDNTVPLGGSHHQKVAIVDGRVAFFGSQDICQARWDDSSHRPENAHRLARGLAHPPYHEVQVAVTGAAARSMVDLFAWRWYGATGERLDPTQLVAEGGERYDLAVTLPMPRARLGLARTIPEVLGRGQVSEVRDLFVRAVERAEHLVYVESQYLTSCAIRDALLRRMADRGRPKLDVVVVLPHKPEGFKEEMTVGVRQTMILHVLDEAAREHGHSLGIYNVLAGTRGSRKEPLYVYIHAKLMIIDDRSFIVGSANLTNRSLTIDSEIVAAYEARRDEVALRNAIRRARVRLLFEHAGLHGGDVRALVRPRGLVARLDEIARSGQGRVRRFDVRAAEQSLVVKAAHDLTLELIDLDPWVDEGTSRTG
jgi:phosphatidylserine/phosphatidylglycerophosphate/cardiolipin synthase-like enzyme